MKGAGTARFFALQGIAQNIRPRAHKDEEVKTGSDGGAGTARFFVMRKFVRLWFVCEEGGGRGTLLTDEKRALTVGLLR